MTNKELKFRAVIVEKNATIYFTIRDLVDVEKHLFSTRELLIPWLLEGNKPDRFVGLVDKNGKEIYDGDIVQWQSHWEGIEITLKGEVASYGITGFWIIGQLHLLSRSAGYVFEIIGNIYEHKSLLEEGK